VNNKYGVPCYNVWSFIRNLFKNNDIVEHYNEFFPVLTQFLSIENIKMELLKELEIDFHIDSLLSRLNDFIKFRDTVEHSAELERFKVLITFISWVHDYIYLYKDFMIVLNDPNDYDRFCIDLWDKEHIYHISVVYSSDERHYHNYLGMTYSCRQQCAGEYHTRGNDGPDGFFTKQQFDEIMKNILKLNIEVF
jgi:hypothetical protein